MHSVRMEATFATTVECLLAMGREFDLASSWNKYMLDSIILSQPSMFEATLYACNWLPFPFSSCDCVVNAKGYDLAEVRSPQSFIVSSITLGICCSPPRASCLQV